MVRRIALFVLLAAFLQGPAKAQAPSPEFQYVGAFSVNTSQDAKVLAAWYSKFFGVEMRSAGGVYFAKWETKAGQFSFSIHPKKTGASTSSSPNVSLVFRVSDCRGYVTMLEGRGLASPPQPCEAGDFGRFAEYKDPDGNAMTVWEK